MYMIKLQVFKRVISMQLRDGHCIVVLLLKKLLFLLLDFIYKLRCHIKNISYIFSHVLLFTKVHSLLGSSIKWSSEFNG